MRLDVCLRDTVEGNSAFIWHSRNRFFGKDFTVHVEGLDPAGPVKSRSREAVDKWVVVLLVVLIGV